MKKSNIIVCGVFLLLLVFCFKYPAETYQSAKYSFLLWLNKLAPFLFVFFILNKVLIDFGIINIFKPFFYPLSKLYNITPLAFFAVLSGFLGGQPTGIKIACDMYSSGKISKQDALSVTTFCSITSPGFILSSLGILFYNDNTVGIILLVSSVLSALITGLLFTNKTVPLTQFETSGAKKTELNFTKTFIVSVSDSMYTVLLVGSYIVFFGICVGILGASGFFDIITALIRHAGLNLPDGITTGFLWGAIEITGGCDKIYMLDISLVAKIIFTSFIINWGGLSVHAQCISFLENAGLSKSPYIKAKSAQAFVAALISYTLCMILF